MEKYESKPTIPYTVRYVTAEIKDGQIDPSTEKVIEERTHTVNKGAMLVTDLYQDGTKHHLRVSRRFSGEKTMRKRIIQIAAMSDG